MNAHRQIPPTYVASIPILTTWMKGWKNPTRAEQDKLAEDIRLARIAARVAVGLCGGRVLAAYVGALRSFLLKDDVLIRKATAAEAEAWGLPAGAKVRFALDGVTLAGDDRLLANGEVGRAAIEARERCGNQNRGSAGAKTREVLRLLGQYPDELRDAPGFKAAAVEAAVHDLAADPSCRALDAALADLGGRPKTARELETQRAILAFERAVGRAQHALRGQVVEVLRLASMGDHLEGPFGGDALTGGAEGQRRAFRVYQRSGPGDLCLGSFARTHWIVQGAVRALRGVWTPNVDGEAIFSLDYQAEDTSGISQGQQAAPLQRDVVGTHDLIADRGPEASILSWERRLDVLAAVERLPEPKARERVNAYLDGAGPLPPLRILDGLRSLLAPDAYVWA